MRIFALELDNDIKGIDKRKAYIESLISKIEKPDLIVLPELSLCSYMGNDGIWDYADSNSLDTTSWAMKMADKYNTYIAVGYVEKFDNEIYNSYLIADKDKVYGIVRKSEAESYIFKRGFFENIIKTPFGNTAVGICYDSRRKHLYNNIKDMEVSLILFPHGSPNDPANQKKEESVNDMVCNSYLFAFKVPVVYVNSTGKMDFMHGVLGKMMHNAGFRLNGLSRIYSDSGTQIETGIKEIIGLETNLVTKKKSEEIHFFNNDLVKGNFLFRHTILKWDIEKGIGYYDKYHNK